MKRDTDLIRSMLFEFEESSDYLIADRLHYNSPPEERKWHYHLELLSDQGFVIPVGKGTYRLSASGHDFLDTIRSDTIWNKTKSGVASIGGATLGMIAGIAVEYLKKEAAEKLGIKLP